MGGVEENEEENEAAIVRGARCHSAAAVMPGCVLVKRAMTALAHELLRRRMM